jgi:acyl transferase domain-containing protein/acyl carrier protein/NADP-dependent 3-hydroxy acid dehydrogenase YdfG
LQQLRSLSVPPKDTGHEPIAIIGIGCRLPGGANSAQAFWELLRHGEEAISEVPADRWDLAHHFDPDPSVPLHQHVRRGGFIDGIDQFDAAFFGISPREAVCMDPQQRLLLEVAWQAIESAGIPLEAVRGTATGVFMGISSSDYSSLLWASPEHYAIPDNEPFVLPGNTGCIAANRLSYFFDFKGPSFTVDTACSSSLVAVHLACESLWRGEIQAALAGGVQALIHPGIQSSFCKAGLLAPDGRCKSFDAVADGYVRSEGAGAVLLKPLSAARAAGDPIVALIHGSAVNSDGRSNGMVAPNLRAQVACVRAAFERAGIDPAATQYVEAHGTGTRQGDPIELRALGTVLGEGRPDGDTCRVGSVKTNLGHSETAAGITGLIKAALCVQHRQLPPSLHFRSPNPSVDFAGLKLQVQTALEPFPHADQPAVVGVSSFGFGGTNAHVVLAEAPKPPPPPRYGQQLPLQLLTVSARTPEALRQQAANLVAWLRARPNLAVADLCASANSRRTQFSRRLVCLGSDRQELLAQLEACSRQGTEAAEAIGAVQGQASRRPGKLAMLFTGQGSQSLGMAQELHAGHPVFREAFERCTDLLDPLLEHPLASVLFPEPGQEEQAATRLNQTAFTQPALFVVGYALSELWASWGVQPDLLLGHSVGEIVAAQRAGVFSLEDALRLVAARGKLMQALPAGGGMVALLAPHATVETLLAGGSELAVAAWNGPANTVVSGPKSALDGLVQRAAAAGVPCQPLAVSHAFHSPAMAPMLAAFERELSRISFSPPRRALVSNVTGELAGPEIAQPDYWCDHVLSPVRFAEGLATLASQGAQTFVEIGARPTLIGMGRQCLPDPSLAWWPSLRPGQNDWQVVLRSLAELHRSGYPIDWRGFHRPLPHRLVPLPGYPFQRQRYWWSRRGEGEAVASLWLEHIHGEVALPPLAPTATPSAQTWAGLKRLALPGGSERRWCAWLAATAPADLADHRIRDQVVFPAAGFLELALQARQLLDEPLTLTDLRLELPLRLDPETAAFELQLVHGTAGLEFHSRAGAAASDGAGSAEQAEVSWRSHGACQFPGPDSPLPETSPPEPVPESAEHLDPAEFYGALERFGLCYGPAFRSLVALRRQEGRAWAELERQPGGHDWTLLDGCFQAVAATLDPQAAAGQLLLPVGLEAITLRQWPLPDSLHCAVELLASDEPAFVQAQLLLSDGAGAAVGWVTGFRLRRLPRAALDWLFPQAEPQALGGPAGPQLVRAAWEPIPTQQVSSGAGPDAGPPAGLLRASTLGPDPAAATAALLEASRLPGDTPLWLLLDGPQQPALAGALDGWVRAAALEQPRRQWLRLHLLDGASEAILPWPEVAALAATEPALAWDGRQLLRQRLRRLAPARFCYATASLGLLESLEAQPLAPQPPAAGELEIAVEATGLNFRDVLNALGLLRSYSRQLGLDDGARVPFGGEAVGRVTAVGPGVDPALVGERVLAALAVGSLASHVLCRAELCLPLPPQLTAVEGASISTAFLTAHYGLLILARLQPGETVLIHAAAGGVGQAALQVARRAGARILATASAAKQQALLEQGVEAVFDSRSLDFAEQVRAHTGGRGVGVVLNSLKGDWVDASFEALAEGGRFVELGKIEIWSRQQAAERRPDATYLPFDLLEVAAAEPQLIRGLLEQLLANLAAGHYQLLPIQEFPLDAAVDAFRLMAQARHVGKVVISQSPAAPAHAILPDATYLVSGALGGLGLQLLQWLADQGATSLLLLARSAEAPSVAAAQLLTSLKERGVTCTALPLNLAATGAAATRVESQLAAALAALPPERPLRGVFHAAGVLDDGLLESQTPERLCQVLAPKLGGWQRIEAALQSDPLQSDPFVVHFSSMASLLGSPGQSNYCAANGALDGLAAATGQLAIQWGPWEGAGMAAGLGVRERQRLEALGVTPLQPAAAFAALEQLLQRGSCGPVAVLDVDWARLSRQASPRQAALMADLTAPAAGAAARDASAEPAYLAVLRGTPLLERHSCLVAFVQQQLAKVMGVGDPQQIDPSEPLFNMGLDSLMALELTVLLETNLGVRLTESLVFEHPTVDDLVHYFLAEVLFPEGRAPEPQPPQPEPQQPTPAWDQQVADVAALDTADLLRQLRGD